MNKILVDNDTLKIVSRFKLFIPSHLERLIAIWKCLIILYLTLYSGHEKY